MHMCRVYTNYKLTLHIHEMLQQMQQLSTIQQQRICGTVDTTDFSSALNLYSSMSSDIILQSISPVFIVCIGAQYLFQLSHSVFIKLASLCFVNSLILSMNTE
jgi:hypothetical protein